MLTLTPQVRFGFHAEGSKVPLDNRSKKIGSIGKVLTAATEPSHGDSACSSSGKGEVESASISSVAIGNSSSMDVRHSYEVASHPMPWVNPLFQHQQEDSTCSIEQSSDLQRTCQSSHVGEGRGTIDAAPLAKSSSMEDADRESLISPLEQTSSPCQGNRGGKDDSLEAIYFAFADENISDGDAEDPEPDMSLFGGMWPTEMEVLMASFSTDSAARQPQVKEELSTVVWEDVLSDRSSRINEFIPPETDAVSLVGSIVSSKEDFELLKVRVSMIHE